MLNFADSDLGTFEVVLTGPDAVWRIKCRQSLCDSVIASVRQEE
jgi:hypothetical protein